MRKLPCVIDVRGHRVLVIARSAGHAAHLAFRNLIAGRAIKRQPRTDDSGWFEDTIVVSPEQRVARPRRAG